MTEQSDGQTLMGAAAADAVAPELQNAQPESSLLEQVGQLMGEGLKSDNDRVRDAEQKAAETKPGDEEESDEEEISEEGLGLQSLKGGGGDAEETKISGLHDLAEKAGISAEDLFNLPVQFGSEREPVTLGEMKDRFENEIDGLDERSETLGSEKVTFENEMIRARGELQELVALLPQIPPEMIQKATANHAANLEKERQALVASMPEWSNPDTYARVKGNIHDFLGPEYGILRGELDSVFDHRLVKILHDFTALSGRVAEAKRNRKRVVKTQKTKVKDSSTSRTAVGNQQFNQQLNKATAAPMHHQAKLDAVKSLLNG